MGLKNSTYSDSYGDVLIIITETSIGAAAVENLQASAENFDLIMNMETVTDRKHSLSKPKIFNRKLTCNAGAAELD